MNWPISSAFRVASVSILSSALLFAATSCEDPNDLSVELPGSSPVTTEYRDYRVNASTILQDSVETLNAERVLAGRLTDATIGTTTAKGYFNLRASSDTLPSAVKTPVLDSVVLVSSFDQVYGSATQPVSFDLFKLKDGLEEKKTYNAGVTDVELGDQIGDKLISSLNRTITTQVAVNPGVLKRKKNPAADSTLPSKNPDQTIRLVIQKDKVRNSDFANTLFTALKDASFNQSKLNALWKGLAIVPSSNQTGAILALNRSAVNCVYVYYHGTELNGTATLKLRYRVRLGSSYVSGDANTPRYYTQITTDFKAPFSQLLDGTQSLRVADSVTYMQQGLGLATKLSIPGLKELANQPGLAINRAELIIPIKSSGTLLFQTNPTSAFLYEINARNRVLQRTVNISPVERIVQANLQNQLGQGREAVVALYDVDSNKKYYSVVITTYLQAYLSNQLGEQAAALMLSPVLRRSFDLSLNRSVLDAQNIKLRVYSSKLR
ncbi:DUF4270 family protein [Hymenobacter cellulosivorans]|uniref:DUF4270 domain-containing protein n=1 Tax=Hymenobacter cellulosivorans TaxID=2932249 RepID=A0ABY4FDY3_9BACT|nr:DUF4270 family protein [Hymenobacter cellulosivorans]UOQ54182.1 DUF4270 domain-containing protein [Hymenobacter cellulosivorans]